MTYDTTLGAISLDGALLEEINNSILDNRDVVQLLDGGKRAAVLN
jgi:hypothetical protein